MGERDREPCVVGRRCPEAGRSELRIDVPLLRNRGAIMARSERRPANMHGVKRLSISAAAHLRWIEYEAFHQFGKGMPRRIAHERLKDHVAAARIAESRARRGLDPNCVIVSRGCALEDLSDSG